MKIILLADDDPCVRDTLAKMLQRQGFEVVEAANGKEAIRHVRQLPVDLVVIDMYMPVMEGVETIIEVRRMRNDLPIIAISGGAVIGARDSLKIAKSLGVNTTLAKPFTQFELLDAIKEISAAASRSDAPKTGPKPSSDPQAKKPGGDVA